VAAIKAEALPTQMHTNLIKCSPSMPLAFDDQASGWLKALLVSVTSHYGYGSSVLVPEMSVFVSTVVSFPIIGMGLRHFKWPGNWI